MAETPSILSPEHFNNFGELLRYLRERAELSQREFALQVGYHYSYMSRIEKNERMPDSATLMARFIPALGLEDEPRWTERLLKLASSEERTIAPRKSGQVASRAPAPASALPTFNSPLASIPLSLTPLLGREKEVETVIKIISRLDVRLVTLVGAPGVGKTRLAIHVANELIGMFAQGAVFADLSAIKEPRDVLPAIASALGIQGSSDMPLMSQIVNSIRQKNLLLVVDNFEHVIDASPQIVQLLGNAPQVKIIVTSREALRISGEHEFTIEPLVVPQAGQNQSSTLLDYAVIQLFAQRAQAVDPNFKLSLDNLKSISEICRRLDGLPLAIELAAARVKFLTPEAMLNQFDRRLDWVAQGTRDSSSTRKTLRGAIEWSYNTLSETERVLMRRLSVFSGGWTADFAEAVCGDADAGASPLLRRSEVLNTLILLTDKSLSLVEKQGEETRFQFLETIHEFAREKLETSGEATTIRNKHLAHFANFAETMETNIDGSNEIKWTRLGDREHSNMRSALDWGLREGANLHDAMRLVSAVSVFWVARSFYIEGFERINAYLARASVPECQPYKAKLLFRGGGIAGYLFDYIDGKKMCEQSVQLARALGRKRDLANALFYLSEILYNLGQTSEARIALEESVSLCWQDNYISHLTVAMTNLGVFISRDGDLKGALSTLEEALAIATQANSIWGTAHALHYLGVVHRYNKTYDESISYMERSLEASIKIGDRHGQAVALVNLSILHNIKQNFPKSDEYAERAFAIFQDIGDEIEQPFPLRMMGYAAIHAGNMVRARVLMRESLMGNYAISDTSGQLACIVGMCSCDVAEKEFQSAVMFCALVEKQVKERSIKLLEPDEIALESVLKQGRKKLGKAAYETAYKQGHSLMFENIVLQLMA